MWQSVQCQMAPRRLEHFPGMWNDASNKVPERVQKKVPESACLVSLPTWPGPSPETQVKPKTSNLVQRVRSRWSGMKIDPIESHGLSVPIRAGPWTRYAQKVPCEPSTILRQTSSHLVPAFNDQAQSVGAKPHLTRNSTCP